MPNPGLRRGSEWRRWDLHVHSPLSALANNFPHKQDGAPDWDQYLSALEMLQGFAALGITDYFSVDGYREIANFKRAGRLSNINLLLPNVELRLDNLVYRSKSEAEPPRRLNLHVIFSDEVAPDAIEEHFLRELKFNYVGNPQAKNEVWKASRVQIEELGKRIKRQQTTFTGSDFEVGCTLVTVDVNDVKDALEGRSSVFKNKYLIVLAEEHLSLISWEGQDHQIRKVLLQGADAVFSGNPETRLWAIGKKDLDAERFKSEFLTLSRPLIIDQPEDNLDSLSVYASLIEYFRKRKKGRQIIIITHNPNLVVNTDAEQIVIAHFDGTRNPRIVYKSGALEDVAGSEQEPSIREGVCRVLEGGREAFLRREQKYAIERL